MRIDDCPTLYPFGSNRIDALVCNHCGDQRRLLTFVSDQEAIQKILHHLGLPAAPPELAAARPPPQRSVHSIRS